MIIHFEYDKKQVLHALRYHFISRPEIKIILIILNVFTILSAVLFYFHKIQPLSFLTFSLLWFVLLVSIWKLLPLNVYKRAHTFRDQFSMDFNEQDVVLQTERGSHTWQWKDFSSFWKVPTFFTCILTAVLFFSCLRMLFRDLGALQEARALLREKLKKGR